MKTKPVNPIKKPGHNDQDDEDSVEVESGGPKIAAAKKSKMVVIAASSVLITVVIYLFFFKEDGSKKENLEAVITPQSKSVSASDDGKSPFEIEAVPEKSKEEVELLSKPATPDVPTLPDLPIESPIAEAITLSPGEQQQKQQIQQPLPVVQQQTQQQAQQQIQQQVQPVMDSQQQAAQQQVQVAKNALDPRYSPIIVFGGVTEGAPARGVGYDKNIVKLNEDPIDGLQKTVTTVSASYIADRVHTIAQGKLLTAVLETAINTEIPGSVRGIVSRDVYGESGNEVLIPRGSRLFGAYSSEISRGQGRVEIGWSRLIRPDGVDLAINFNASDQFGRSGLSGDVDNKYNSIIANSMLTSILAVGGVAAAQKLLTNNSATTTTTNPTQGTTTTTGSATNQALYDVSKTIIDTVGQVIGNTIDVDPVIRVPQGTRITVIVNADITIPSMSKR
jgi:type IV secretion system protein VirB10